MFSFFKEMRPEIENCIVGFCMEGAPNLSPALRRPCLCACCWIGGWIYIRMFKLEFLRDVYVSLDEKCQICMKVE